MRRNRITGLVVAAVSAGAIATVLLSVRPSEAPTALAIVLAMAWGAAPQAVDALFGEPVPLPPRAASPGSVTVAVHVGREPVEVSRASVVAAAATTPTIVVATEIERVDALGAIDIPVFVAPTIEDALAIAASTIQTDAVLLLSAGAFPELHAVRTAAGLIREGAGWVIGGAVPFNGDAYAPAVRDRLGRQLRASARRSGLRVWEPDATVISTQLLRDRPMEPGRPRGAWLRAWAASGVRSEETPAMLAITGEPVDANAYWPSSVLGHRGSVADLADAITSNRGRLRWLGIGLLLRELYAFPLAFWLLTPWLISLTAARPFTSAPWIIVALVVVPAVLRWVAERLAHGVALHPLEDALATAYDAPGSVLALSAVVTRRVASTRMPLPGQPLAWAALGFASITLVPLLSAGPQNRRLTTVGMALIELGLLWLFAMRAVFQRDWSRAMYRVPVRLPARVGGRQATTREVSPVGMAVEGRLAGLSVGSEVSVEIDLDDGSVLLADATIASRRIVGDGLVLGMTLNVGSPNRVRWTAQLSRAASAATHEAGSRRLITHCAPQAPTRRRVLAGGAAVLIGVTALTATVMLCLALAGYRPLVVRSGSMEPSFGAGDIVLVEDVAVGKLAVRDIVTFPDPSDDADTLTHRVVETARDGRVVTVVTRGDANTTAESFTASVDTVVARVVWHVPGNGSWIAWAGGPPVRWGVGLSALGVGAAVWHERRTARRAPIDWTERGQ